MRKAAIKQLVGKTITKIVGMERGSERIIFEIEGGLHLLMWHEQDCCENVSLVDICGDPKDLLGSPIIRAHIKTNKKSGVGEYHDEHETWTFYDIGTARGYVTLRWLGSSSGYYSERVDLHWVTAKEATAIAKKEAQKIRG
jgi:hypothetical protein